MASKVEIWSSGGGVQSAAIAALIASGRIQKPDYAVIVDTEREQSTTWDYMDAVITPALQSVGVVLHRVKKSDYAKTDLWGGADGESLLIPAFTNLSGEAGKLPTFCSSEWKSRVVQRWAKEVSGADQFVSWLGISTDEMRRVKASFGKWQYRYPLIEQKMNRGDCIALVTHMGWPNPPRSSCWMCPNHTQEEWRDIKENKPEDWKKVVAFEKEIQRKDPNAFLHGDCIPIDKCDFSEANESLFNRCDSGMCFV